ncbi:MAG: M15 family metallopeptidase [Treponemataceae bacterium]
MQSPFFFLVILFSLFTLSHCVTSFDSTNNPQETPHEIQTTLADQSNTNIYQKTKKDIQSILKKEPDVDRVGGYIFASFKLAYPEKILSFYVDQNDWILELRTGETFYWANGRILPKKLKDNWSDYEKYPLYAYTGEARNPNLFTKEIIAEIKKQSATRQSTYIPQEEWLLGAIFNAPDRRSTETLIVKSSFLGKRVNIHREIKNALQRVHIKINEEAQINPVVSAFIASVTEVGGYNWRVISGTKRRSNHSYGLAIDLVFKGFDRTPSFWDWERKRNANWITIAQSKLWQPPEKVIQFFKEEGFIWGGAWNLYDTMHFEYRPELIHLANFLPADTFSP